MTDKGGGVGCKGNASEGKTMGEKGRKETKCWKLSVGNKERWFWETRAKSL